MSPYWSSCSDALGCLKVLARAIRMDLIENIFADLLELVDMLESEPDLEEVRDELLIRAKALEYILVLEG